MTGGLYTLFKVPYIKFVELTVEDPDKKFRHQHGLISIE